ncbi:alpha-1,4-glucan:maltose-1-phosphate maltosyltransferase [Motilibacter rhizosphaerae]|uniref:Alpha-1,4-glucan:maltose-1-phosphate maltosyltransferase n=1 Tax=Motilibacter rhizosphaerae TaxID=598652 RepID=A0A4Q7NPT4_9ACTN|nr:alpha-1,4-glucan--maltose-1-phosphate maltosyltransferase [Motilibacter rhizosphaerae]RZS87068.1 alpha-1,4-glucan:maltose-1-phosphate maltosyltransferase [Motilibacter rhizosphaerae]
MTTTPATSATAKPTVSPAQPAPAAPSVRWTPDVVTGRIPIDGVSPVVSDGRYPAKSVVGERFPVTATVTREGHDAVAANVVLRDPDGRPGPWTPLVKRGPGLDLWDAEVVADREGRWTITVEAWSDPYATWLHDAGIKIPVQQDVELMLEEGARLLERAAAGSGRSAEDAAVLHDGAAGLRDGSRPAEARFAAGTSEAVQLVLAAAPLRDLVTESPAYPLEVSRERALYGSWYEFFPRSEGASLDPPRSGTLRTAAERLPAVAAMGFEVVYIPPIHPIGTTARKGRNNTLDPGPDDPGVPWAIGAPTGGHDAVHPDLGTIEDWDAFAAAARDNGLEIALDLALQASPDHPWVQEHPEWFTTRADGTIAYAENPPKKYQDIYPINFDNDPQGIYTEVLRIVRHWIEHGVTIFRVDNPHTKPVQFWEWLLREVHATNPEVLFLSEAFTRPAMMHLLAKVGFHQSYTYFTWRTTKQELTDYFTELSQETSHFLRPNAFTNTQDILHAYLQYGGPAAFKIRATLAATLSPTYGIYSGFELYEHVALRPGSEEYLDSEKYQYRPRDYAAAEREGRSLAPYLRLLNQLRRDHPALQRLRNLHFHPTDSEHVLAYSKREVLEDGTDDVVIVVVNLDPHAARSDVVHLDLSALGLTPGQQFAVHDEVTGQTFWWGEHDYVLLDPYTEPAHVLTVRKV